MSARASWYRPGRNGGGGWGRPPVPPDPVLGGAIEGTSRIERGGAVRCAAWAALLAAGFAVRWFAARGDLWLDEIWSLGLASAAGSVGRVLTATYHDNNHHLTTIWMLVVGPDAPPLAHRALAVASAVVAMAALALRPLRVGRAASMAWTLLFAFSPVLVHYGSEARGYSGAIGFAMVSVIALDRLLRDRSPAWAAVFAAAAVGGILSHLTYLFAVAACGAWVAVDALYERRRGVRRWIPILSGFAVPLAFLTWLWAVELRFLVVGGGPDASVLRVLEELLRRTLGLPSGPLVALGVIVLVGALYELVDMIRRRRSEWAFFATVIVIAPAAALAWARTDHLAPRYLLVGTPFFLGLAAIWGVRLWQAGGWMRLAACLAAGGFLAGSSIQLRPLLEDGRGRYGEAVSYIVRNSPPGAIAVASDHDFRNSEVLLHFAKRIPGGERIVHVSRANAAGAPPRWYLQHDFAEVPRDEPSIAVDGLGTFRLMRAFPSAGLSGWRWRLYRREPVPLPPDPTPQ